MNIDNFRIWFNEREKGQLQQLNSFQSNIICQSIQPTLERQLLLDQETLNICQPLCNINDPNNINNSTNNNQIVVIDHDLIVSEILQNISILPVLSSSSFPSINRSESQYPRNIFDMFEFSNDLKIGMSFEKINREESKNKIQPPIQAQSKNQNQTESKETGKLSKNSTSSSLSTTTTARQNPFKSAKEKFDSEGGQLAPEKSSNTTSTNMRSVVSSVTGSSSSRNQSSKDSKDSKDQLPESLQHFDKNMIQKLESDIWQEKGKTTVTFRDIAGLEFAKKCVQELVCWPMLRPDIFKGLRALPRGLLLFGPPGTGKTLIGKAIANQVGATFFCISASSLTSKWVGESESAVRALFSLGVHYQPAIIFIDEIDSLLTQRSSDESEASRRIKTEFLVQLDGASTNNDAMVVVIGATNRPEELDEAARRRFVKRLYIPLPDESGRKQLIETLLKGDKNGAPTNLVEEDVNQIVQRTQGFSGADLKALCTEAALGPVREVTSTNPDLNQITLEDVPPISFRHFTEALGVISPSVSGQDLQKYINWNTEFGTYRRME